MSVPNPMPVISRDCPAFTNDDFSGAFPPGRACNAVYGGQNYWRTLTAPVGNADSGTLTQAVYLAYDLSSVPSGQRQQVVAAWYNDPSTDPYDSSLISVNYFNVPKDYTIESNSAAGGGSPPGSGWTTLATVTSNSYHSRQHAVNLAGANWIRIVVTGIRGSIFNNNAAINFDIHDAHLGNQDNLIFYGDSITQRGLDHDDINLGAILAAQINALAPVNWPVLENGGVGGYTAADGVAHISTWLALFSGKYVGLLYGTNDANGGGALLTNFQSNMQSMIDAIVAAGKVPVMPQTIPWGKTSAVQTNGPTINTKLAALFAANPQIVRGPDLWAYFFANQSLIIDGDVHMTDPAGYTAYRAQWASALVANLYTATDVIADVVMRRRRRAGIF